MPRLGKGELVRAPGDALVYDQVGCRCIAPRVDTVALQAARIGPQRLDGQLDEMTLAARWAEGRALPVEQVVTEALADLCS
jgi:hypothetical protein